ILKRYFQGEVCPELDFRMLNQLGAMLARLHQIPSPEYLPKTFPYGLDYFETLPSSFSGCAFAKWLINKQDYLINTIDSRLPRGLVHGDVFYDNVLFSTNHQLMAVIDFEEACQYYKVFDLGMCIVGTCANRGEISLSKAKAFIDGYQSIKSLQESEKAALQVFAEYGAVATSFWRFRQHHVLKPDKNKANRYHEMKALADSIHLISGDEFRKICT
ncbi:hypothetical protein BVY01_01295, partial [bacterium I07]